MKQKLISPFRNVTNSEWKELIKLLEEKNIQTDLLDLNSVDKQTDYDNFLLYLREQYGLTLFNGLKEVKNSQEKYDFLVKQTLEKEEEKTQEEFKKSIKEIVKNKNPNLDKYFEVPKALLRAVIKDKEGSLNSLFWQSPAGLSKTTTVLTTLTEEKADFIYINNYISPVELVNLIYKYKSKIICCDDVEGIFSDKVINILKGALGGIGKKNERIVSYHTIDKRLTAPAQFNFTGKLIFLLNKMPNNENELINALLSRSLVYESRFTYKEIMEILAEFVKIDYKDIPFEKRNEIFTYLSENSDESTENLNFRSLIKLYDLYRVGEDWKVLSKVIITKDERKALIRKLLKESNTIKEAEKKFMEETGMCRASFFNLRKQMSNV